MVPTTALGRIASASPSFTLFSSSMVLIAAEPVRSQPDGLRFEVRLGHAPAVAEAAGRRSRKLSRARAGCWWCWGARNARSQTHRRADRQERPTGARPRRRRPRPGRRGGPRRPFGDLPDRQPAPASTRNLCGPGPLAHQPRPERSQRARRPVQRGDDRAARPGRRRDRRPGAVASRAGRDAAARFGAGQVSQDPLEAAQRLPRPADRPARGRDPAARLRARAGTALPGEGPHRRLRRHGSPTSGR